MVFQAPPSGDGAWIKGGFFALTPERIDRINGDATIWARGPLTGLAANGRLEPVSI